MNCSTSALYFKEINKIIFATNSTYVSYVGRKRLDKDIYSI